MFYTFPIDRNVEGDPVIDPNIYEFKANGIGVMEWGIMAQSKYPRTYTVAMNVPGQITECDSK